MTPAVTSTQAPSEGQFFGHPRGLSTLFFTEMWERFSYYGMRGILVLFMVNALETGGMGLTDATAAAIYGMYTAGVYLFALPGGWMADRLLGKRQAVFVGGVIIAAGHFSMAVPTSTFFFFGLILIVLGTGLLKPNVSAIVGDLYPDGGARRDAGFSVFYMGINLGAFIGPLVVGYLGENISWHLGFSAAGIGMLLGLIQYKLGDKHLGSAGALSEEAQGRTGDAWRQFAMGVAVVFVVGAGLFALSSSGAVALTLERAAQATGVIIVLLAIIYFLAALLFFGLDGDEKKRLFLIFLLFLGSAMFWSGFEQAGSSMNLFAERLTDRVVFGWEAPASWLQSVNPLFIILLAPVAGSLWLRLGDRAPSISAKFGIGLSLLGIGFLVLAWASVAASDANRVTPVWLIVTYFLHTCGELALSPVGLSSVTKLSPKRLVGQMMGIWFMGTALGNLIAGLVAGQFERLPLVQLFGAVAGLALGTGLIFLVLKGPISRLAGDAQ
jgi:POT family proton-dependent oligopeptide transporter